MKKLTAYPLGVIVAIFCLMSMDMTIGVQKGRGGSSCLTETTEVISQFTETTSFSNEGGSVISIK